jgi:hypothetical protein
MKNFLDRIYRIIRKFLFVIFQKKMTKPQCAKGACIKSTVAILGFGLDIGL